MKKRCPENPNKNGERTNTTNENGEIKIKKVVTQDTDKEGTNKDKFSDKRRKMAEAQANSIEGKLGENPWLGGQQPSKEDAETFASMAN